MVKIRNLGSGNERAGERERDETGRYEVWKKNCQMRQYLLKTIW